MEGDRFRIPLNDSYALSLGRAAYVFGILEWNAVWCCEASKPGYVSKVRDKPVMQIADDLDKAARNYPDPGRRDALAHAAVEFRRLIQVRNDIMHARPSTDLNAGGAQHVNRHGTFWSTEEINDAADAFAACSIELRSFMTV